MKQREKTDKIFQDRMAKKTDELRWLYMELYGNDSMFFELCDQLHRFYEERTVTLKALDRKREADPGWYKKNDMLGMMFYIDNFAGNMKGVESKLDYLEKNNVNYIHLMPFLDTPKGRSDGGYAVADFRKVQENLGTMDDLEELTDACHKKGISVCMDFVMNHTSEDHEWAKKARQGDGEYMSRYFFYDNSYIPSLYEKTVPQVFPTTAPGNFTWLPEIGHYLISEIVCPGVILLGEVVMEPEKVVPYFGTVEKPECHMLYNVTTMATTWHTVATRDVRLLKKQLDIVNGLPKDYVFLNYLRCHDDIGWGLDYATLQQEGIEERSHKKYLNDYFQGFVGESNSRGVLYNEDPVTGDARFCGTTASMCGIEKAGFEKNKAAMEKAIQLDVMLHAYMFMQSGIPVIYSGDEIGQVNDYSYKNDPDKAPDSRYIHRGAMNWDRAAMSGNARTVEGKLNKRLLQLEKIRKTEKAFMTNADTWTVDTWDISILCIGRYYEGEKIYGLFNFSEYDKTAWINERDGIYKDLITGQEMEAAGVNVPAYGFFWLKKIN